MTQSDVAVLKTKLENLHEKIDSISNLLEKHIAHEESQLEKLVNQMEKDYARKWVEIVVGFVIFAVSTSVVWWAISQQATIQTHLIKTEK